MWADLCSSILNWWENTVRPKYCTLLITGGYLVTLCILIKRRSGLEQGKLFSIWCILKIQREKTLKQRPKLNDYCKRCILYCLTLCDRGMGYTYIGGESVQNLVFFQPKMSTLIWRLVHQIGHHTGPHTNNLTKLSLWEQAKPPLKPQLCVATVIFHSQHINNFLKVKKAHNKCGVTAEKSSHNKLDHINTYQIFKVIIFFFLIFTQDLK